MLTNDAARQSLKKLMDGNQRFCQGLRSVESMATVFNLQNLAATRQTPHSMILACSDSRTPVETLFDQGLGDVFVMRVAGNIAATSLVASMEYAFLNLEVPLCMVMGHTQCGAVTATVERKLGGSSIDSQNLKLLTDEIYPSADLVIKSHKEHHEIDADLINLVCKENVFHTIEKIKKLSPIIDDLVKKEKALIIGALYEMDTGKVILLE